MPATSFVQALKRTGYTQFTDKGINGQQMTKWQTRILQVCIGYVLLRDLTAMAAATTTENEQQTDCYTNLIGSGSL
jgi:hypothetical protein